MGAPLHGALLQVGCGATLDQRTSAASAAAGGFGDNTTQLVVDRVRWSLTLLWNVNMSFCKAGV
jgi:hypothetical protein